MVAVPCVLEQLFIQLRYLRRPDTLDVLAHVTRYPRDLLPRLPVDDLRYARLRQRYEVALSRPAFFGYPAIRVICWRFSICHMNRELSWSCISVQVSEMCGEGT